MCARNRVLYGAGARPSSPQRPDSLAPRPSASPGSARLFVRGATTHRTDPPPPVLNSEMAIFGPGGHVHVRSRTEKRPSSRPLLLSNRPLFAVYMPYLLSYCAGATSCPDPAVTAPPLALAYAASVSCVMGHGEWLCCCCICCIAALYLLLYLLLLLLLLLLL